MVARAIATAMRVASNKEGSGEGGKSDDNSDKGGGQATAMAMKRVMVMATRVADKQWQPRQ
jgi:hypothetical protein